MASLPDWIQLVGYLFFFAAVLVAVYLFFPPSRPVVPRRRESRRPLPAAEPGDLVARADAHERYPRGHSERVAALALALAGAAGLPRETRERIHQAAIFHDLGMLEVPEALIAKPGSLSPAENAQIWRHSVKGAAQVLDLTRDAEMATWVRWAHERWDGLGFPDGLAGVDIPLASRILRLADSAEAMLHPRPYRGALVPDDVAREIEGLSGIVFDPALVPLFLEHVLPNHVLQQVSVGSLSR
ncbi:MAG: HD domain-containing phosphohydrolase [Candidatus Sericytochromatia bacterium]|nr:HD domain-containing phosphohydrolase [Candidatus Sericytochromatia bacterium]